MRAEPAPIVEVKPRFEFPTGDTVPGSISQGHGQVDDLAHTTRRQSWLALVIPYDSNI